MLKLDKDVFVITKSSFEQLYLQHWERLYVFCYKTIEDEETAKEVVQDVFKSLWERRTTLQLHEVERYLIRSVKLRTYEHIRNKVIRTQHHEVLLQRSATHYTDDYIGTQELLSRIKQLVNTLPKQCKHVFQLSRDQGLTNREIASQLYISERAVEYHISRALRTLKTHLSDYIG
ncbi:RNA polymerase sigma-70 factor [Parapedobacter koreensis]|uniref:RNA polymerase sigma-70 factor, ECF subfamily n=1 Tax=Parapedobacter koreensis TaxID=332977 RepID=A0A1H7S549_9SPHI|nr:RNA polymerase sigma-70 factor [Parapedobacter koreensis]SEL66854.1 RNA polymerase sigma-70 factor, ECF subfamily [Parapedobacter koreensis]